jgi:hypothetical protein
MHKMSWNSRSRLNFAHALNKFTHTHTHTHTHKHTHSHQSYNTFLPPLWEKCLTCGTPLGGSWEWIKLPFHPVGRDLTADLWNSSWRFLGVDQAPLPSSGTGPDLGLISWGWCLPSPDKTARWVGPLLLGVRAGSRLFRELGHQGEGEPGIPSGGVPPHSVLCPSLLRCSPAAGWWHKGPVGWNLAGASICCGNIVRGETKQHSEEWRTQILIFTLAGPDVYQCLSPEQRIHRIFKRQCRVSGYKECALP